MNDDSAAFLARLIDEKFSEVKQGFAEVGQRFTEVKQKSPDIRSDVKRVENKVDVLRYDIYDGERF